MNGKSQGGVTCYATGKPVTSKLPLPMAVSLRCLAQCGAVVKLSTYIFGRIGQNGHGATICRGEPDSHQIAALSHL